MKKIIKNLAESRFDDSSEATSHMSQLSSSIEEALKLAEDERIEEWADATDYNFSTSSPARKALNDTANHLALAKKSWDLFWKIMDEAE